MGRRSTCLMLAVLAMLAGCARESGADATADAAAPDRVMTGEQVYQHWCADCHDPGAGHPATLRMAGDLGAERAVLKDLPGLSRELVTTAVRNGFQMMPPFRPTEISDAELQNLAAYLVKQ